jgi:hypothetical protein
LLDNISSIEGEITSTRIQAHPLFSVQRRQTVEEALGPASAIDGFDRRDVTNLPFFKHSGITYVHEDHLARERAKGNGPAISTTTELAFENYSKEVTLVARLGFAECAI